MKRYALLATAAAVLLSFSAPALAEDAPAPAKTAQKATKDQKDYVILKVNGEEVMFSEVQAVWKNFFPGGAAPEFNTFDEKVRQAILREVASKHLVYDQAIKEGVDKREDVQKRLAQLERQLVIQSFVEDKTKHLVSEEKLKKAYEAKVAALKDKQEMRARHILVATEDEAKEVVKRLDKGEKFEEIAKQKSTDKGSAQAGGDLGYFTEEKMVPAFAKAAFALKNGETSQPVKSDFGWHIIKAEDRRKVTAPRFEEIKAALVEEVVNEELTKILNDLTQKAEIKYYGPDGKEKEFSKAAPPKADQL